MSGWVLVFLSQGKCLVEYDDARRILSAGPELVWAKDLLVDEIKAWLAGRDQLKGWEEYGYGKSGDPALRRA